LPIDTTNDDDFLLMMMLAADYEQFHYCDYPSLNIKKYLILRSYAKVRPRLILSAKLCDDDADALI